MGYLLSAQVRLQNLLGKTRRMIKKWTRVVVPDAHSDIPSLFFCLPPHQRSKASCDFLIDTATFFIFFLPGIRDFFKKGLEEVSPKPLDECH